MQVGTSRPRPTPLLYLPILDSEALGGHAGPGGVLAVVLVLRSQT